MEDKTEPITLEDVEVPNDGWIVVALDPCKQIVCGGCQSVFKWIGTEFQDRNFIWRTFMSVDPVCKIFYVGKDFPKKHAKTFLVDPGGNRLMNPN